MFDTCQLKNTMYQYIRLIALLEPIKKSLQSKMLNWLRNNKQFFPF